MKSIKLRQAIHAILFAGVVPGISSVALADSIAVNALPSGGQVVSGQANITQTTAAMNIQQSSQKTILNWQNFNIGENASVNFTQPNPNAVALNRIQGSNASSILGNLTANGQVFLVNPNGILFGQNSSVDVGGLVASSLDISDADFSNSDYLFERGGATGSVLNQGSLAANYIALLAPEVINEGIIAANMGTAALAAGDAVTLDIVGNNLIDIQVDQASINTLIENRRLIEAEAGTVLVSARSANDLIGRVVNTGQIQAAGLINDGGVIKLVASSNISSEGSINADAGEIGKGGTVTLIADLTNSASQTIFSGDISAKGGAITGDGGFVETSASTLTVTDSASVDTSANHGESGSWLLDPTDFTVGLTGGDITGATLSTALATNNVTIQSGTGTDSATDQFGANGTNGDIFINDSINWSNNTKLTIKAGRTIEVNAPITSTGAAGSGVALEFGQDKLAADFTNAGNYFIHAPINLTSASSFSTKFGSDGTTDDYTVLTTKTDLQGISLNSSAKYAVGANIDASGANWSPIGNGATFFGGVLDGLGHTVSNITKTNTTNEQYVGLFGRIGPPGAARNIGVINANVGGTAFVGALAGENSGFIFNSYSSGGTVTGSDLAGIGPNILTNDDNVYAIGGLVGQNTGSIVSSYSYVDVTANSGNQTSGMGLNGAIGGLAGSHMGGIISSSYASGSVTGINEVGGFVGYLFSGIDNSYSRGAVTGNTNVGGFVGLLDPFLAGLPGLLDFTYWDVTSSGQATSSNDGFFNTSTGLTTANSKKQSSYGLDFNNFWVIREDASYPLLRSLFSPLYVAADSKTKLFDGNVFSPFTAKLSKGAGVGSDSNINGALTFTGDAITATNVGSYTIIPQGLSLADSTDQHGYLSISYLNNMLTIDPSTVTITTTLQGSVNKVYDGTNVATFSSNNFLLTGVETGDSLTIVDGKTGTFNDKNVGTGKAVSITLANADYIAGAGTLLSNYILDTSNLTANIGSITAKPVTLTAPVVSKTYDGTTSPTAALDLASIATAAGFAAGDTITSVTAVFADKNAGTGKTVSLSSPVISDGNNGNNYSLSFAANNTSIINKKDVTLTFPSALTFSKVYDGSTTTIAPVNIITHFINDITGESIPGIFDGIVASEAAPIFGDPENLLSSQITFSGTDVGTYNATIELLWNKNPLAGDAAADPNNYNLPTTITGIGAGSITPKEIKPAIRSDVTLTKIYDGSATGNVHEYASLLNTDETSWGFVEGELALTPVTGITFIDSDSDATNDKNVGTKSFIATFEGWAVADGFASTTKLSNYSFPTSSTYTDRASITPKTIGLVATKTYDATTNLDSSEISISGLIGSETLQVNGAATSKINVKDNSTNFITFNSIGNGTGLAANYSAPNQSTNSLNSVIINTRAVELNLSFGSQEFNKEYDGNTNIENLEVYNFGILDEVTDEVLIPESISASFLDKNAGSNKTAEFYPTNWQENDSLLNSIIDALNEGSFFSTPREEKLSAGDPSNYSLSSGFFKTGEITKRQVTAELVGSVDKVYDGTNIVNFSSKNFNFSNFVEGEGIQLPSTNIIGTGAVNAGTNQFASLEFSSTNPIAGTDLDNYDLPDNLSGQILNVTPKLLTATTTVNNRSYDGTTGATFNVSNILGLVDGENLGVSATGSYASKNVGDQVATANYILSNGQSTVELGQIPQTFLSTNYQMQSSSHQGSITPKQVSIIPNGISAIYNASLSVTSDATILNSLSEQLGVAADKVTNATLTLNDKNVGQNKHISASGFTINDGNGGENYALTYSPANDAEIMPATLAFNGINASNKIYDATQSVVVSGSAALLDATAKPGEASLNFAPYTGDNVNISGLAQGTFNSKDVNAANTVTLSNLTITGEDASNYTIRPESLSLNASIEAKPLTIDQIFAPTSKVYDGNNLLQGISASLASPITKGAGSGTDGTPYAGDEVSIGTGFFNNKIGTFNSADVASANSVSFTTFLLGEQASNYSIPLTTNTPRRITPKELQLIANANLKGTKQYDATTNFEFTAGQINLLASCTPLADCNATDGKPLKNDDVEINQLIGTFNSKDVLTGNSISVGPNVTLTGNKSSNYSLNTIQVEGSISPKPVNIALSVPERFFDGTNTAVFKGEPAFGRNANTFSSVSIPFNGDQVTISGQVTGTYPTLDVFKVQNITVNSSDLSLTGTDAPNYSIIPPTATSRLISKNAQFAFSYVLQQAEISATQSGGYAGLDLARGLGNVVYRLRDLRGALTTGDSANIATQRGRLFVEVQKQATALCPACVFTDSQLQNVIDNIR